MSDEAFPRQGESQLIQVLDSIIYFCVVNARDAKQRYGDAWVSKLVGIVGFEVTRRHGTRLLSSTILRHLVRKAPQAFVFQGWRDYCKTAIEYLVREEDKAWAVALENQEGSWKGGAVPTLWTADRIRIGGRKAKTLAELDRTS